MNNPYIQSITLSLPAYMVNGDSRSLREYFKSNNFGRYYKYCNTSLFLIELISYDENYKYSIWSLVYQYLSTLKNDCVLSPEFSIEKVGIHEIRLRFDIPIPNAIFCNTEGFIKSNENTYHSRDYYVFLRKNKSKGIQQSFLTVNHFNFGSSVLMVFSKKYLKYFINDLLKYGFTEFKEILLSFGSIYITQATNPNYFRIANGYVPFLPKPFYSILSNANWFNGKYYRRNISKNFIGGLYYGI